MRTSAELKLKIESWCRSSRQGAQNRPFNPEVIQSYRLTWEHLCQSTRLLRAWGHRTHLEITRLDSHQSLKSRPHQTTVSKPARDSTDQLSLNQKTEQRCRKELRFSGVSALSIPTLHFGECHILLYPQRVPHHLTFLAKVPEKIRVENPVSGERRWRRQDF